MKETYPAFVRVQRLAQLNLCWAVSGDLVIKRYIESGSESRQAVAVTGGRWGCVVNSILKESALWADAFYKSKCPSVCLSVCVFTFEVPFKRLFVPTSRSWMSNIFRDLESLGKSNGKKWSQIGIFFLEVV